MFMTITSTKQFANYWITTGIGMDTYFATAAQIDSQGGKLIVCQYDHSTQHWTITSDIPVQTDDWLVN